MWLRLFAILLCINTVFLSPTDEAVRPIKGAKCWCNFEALSSELQDLNKPDSNHAEQVFSFVHTLVSLNFKLNIYFTEFRQCIRLWLNSIRLCDPSCSCRNGSACCRFTAFRTLDKGLMLLKNQVKHTFTEYSNLRFLNENFQQAMFDVLNVYSGSFHDFLTALKVDKTKADAEAKHFLTIFSFLERKKPLNSIFAISTPNENNTKSVITRLAEHYYCDTTKVLPFYLNVYGLVMQYLFLRELQAELKAPSSQASKSQFTSEIEWKYYLSLTDNMTKQIIFCSTSAIYAIRTQEIKEKDMAMRNAAIVFSCFLLVLVIIIALIVFFACKAKPQNSSSLTIRDETIQKSFGSPRQDSLLKRYYETDESL